MQEFIQMVTQRLGISESQATSATGGLLKGLQQHISEQDFSELQEKLPGSQEVMQEAPEQEAAGGSLLAKVGSLGGTLGTVGGLIAPLTKSGLTQDKASGFIQMFLDYVRSKAGADLLGRIVGQVPGLSALAGQPTQ
ncbi:MAG: DUF2780 domain-containing protein [Armatimonadia bacterium]